MMVYLSGMLVQLKYFDWKNFFGCEYLTVKEHKNYFSAGMLRKI